MGWPTVVDGLVVQGRKCQSSYGEVVYRIYVQSPGKFDQFWVENSSFYKVLRSLIRFDGTSVDLVDETPDVGTNGEPYSAVLDAIRQWEAAEWQPVISR